jgi:hypothetical protein
MKTYFEDEKLNSQELGSLRPGSYFVTEEAYNERKNTEDVEEIPIYMIPTDEEDKMFIVQEGSPAMRFDDTVENLRGKPATQVVVLDFTHAILMRMMSRDPVFEVSDNAGGEGIRFFIS